ncbi:MAG: SufS family cysteine desulfurase [Bacteroidales bacterium]
MFSDQDIKKIREDFPILHQEVNKRPLVYLDNAATVQKPLSVIQSVSDYYLKINSNIHRGVHHLSQVATEAHENGRKHVQAYINAKHSHEVVFTRGTTEAINLVASSFADRFLNKGDEILISCMEHHSNIVPWQLACQRKGAILKVIPINDQGEIIQEEYEKLLNEKTRLLALTHISNALGTINPIKDMIQKAHNHSIPVLIDGAQGAPHSMIDVQDLDCDFYAFSGHKVYAPMGIGVLYGKEHWLNELPPYQGGGEMVDQVTFDKTTYNELPFKFEAGTPNVDGVIGLDAALTYVEKLGIDNIAAWENELLIYATQKLKEMGDIRFIGEAKEKASVISFLIGEIHPFDAGTIIDKLGIALRTGHHCAQPVLERLGVVGTMRASFAFYNTKEEVDRLVDAINIARDMLV